MTAHDTDDDAADKGRGTTRRAFLGAASAVAALAATGTSTATTDDQGATETVDVTRDDYGTVKGTRPEREGVSSFLELHSTHDRETTVSVEGYRYDEGGKREVNMGVSMEGANISIGLDPAQARTIGEDLLAAADHASGEDGDVTSSSR